MKRNYFLLGIFLFFIISLSCLLWLLNSDMMQLERPVDFSDGWYLDSDPDTNTVLLSRKVSENMLGKVVCFYTYDAFIDADINGIPVYHFGQSTSFLKSPGSLWHMVEIPADALGKTLSIHSTFAYDYKFTTDFDFMLGSSGAVILRLLRNEIVDLSVNCIMMILGVILCSIFLLQFKNRIYSHSNLYLGLLSLCFVFWTNNNLFFTQLVFPYGAGQYFSYYFFLFMLPLLLMCYLETITVALKFDRLYWSHIILIAALTFLQLTGIAEFTETISVFLIYSGVEMILAVIKLLRSKQDHSNKIRILAFVVMILCILLNAAMFFLNPAKGISTTISKIGISLYLMLSIYISLGSVITDLAEANQSKMLRKIAFTDSLTGVGNRYAFNDEISNLPLHQLALFSLDINNLKYYNDTFGHACGDTLICESTKILNQLFELLYRTGGDEFIAIKTDCSETDLSDLKSRLNELMRIHNEADPDVLVEIACGYSLYQENDVTYEDILRRADALMYQDKAALKKASRLKSVR